jgi:LysM repeat protein
MSIPTRIPLFRRNQNIIVSLTILAALLISAVSLVSAKPLSQVQPQSCPASITVVAGDNLSRIAQRCNTTVQALLQANPQINDPQLLYVGQVLRIPSLNPFQQPPRSVAIAPASGTPGTIVDFIANSFPPNTDVVIALGPVDTLYSEVARATTSPNGTVQGQVTIPNTALLGEYWVVQVIAAADFNMQATPTPSSRDSANPAQFTVQALSYPFQVAPQPGLQVNPQVSVSPAAGTIRQLIRVSATGFPINTPVDIGVGLQNSVDEIIATGTTDYTGALVVQVNLPQSYQNAGNVVFIVSVPRQVVSAVSGPYTITAAQPTAAPATPTAFATFSTQELTPVAPTATATLTPPPATETATATTEGTQFDTTLIHLIAIADNGASGEMIGCQDSVIPITIQIEPTVAPLTAAFNQLLSLKTEFYGESGYYNALWQSNLILDGITIENGVATVNLSGTIVQSGVCDAPRIEAQLRKTALQYNTVTTANILVNGTPLEQVLSQQ